MPVCFLFLLRVLLLCATAFRSSAQSPSPEKTPAPADDLIYFCTKNGNVFRLPVKMAEDTAQPAPVP